MLSRAPLQQLSRPLARRLRPIAAHLPCAWGVVDVARAASPAPRARGFAGEAAADILREPCDSGAMSSGSRAARAGAGLSSGRRPPKVLVQPLRPFVDDRFPEPEQHVAAFLLDTAIDLLTLRRRLTELRCPTVMWQGQVLFCGSSEELGQQRCSAVFLPDGCVICWGMSRRTERLVLDLSADSPKERRGPAPFVRGGAGIAHCHRQGAAPGGAAAEAGARRARGGEAAPATPLAVERLDVVDADAGVSTSVDPRDGTVRLTREPLAQTSHQLGISLGLAVAVRLDALEARIEAKLEDNWKEMNRTERGATRAPDLRALSRRIFVMETGLHDLRYELNSEAGLVDAPDLLWEHALAERLYDQVVAHHDTRRRTALLNERLSYSLDYLHTLSEHVRHEYSSRLERVIIILIFFELCLALVEHAPRVNNAFVELVTARESTKDVD